MRVKPEQLKEFRLLAGLSLRTAAEVTGIPKSTLWAAERGISKLSHNDFQRITLLYSRHVHTRRVRIELILEETEGERA